MNTRYCCQWNRRAGEDARAQEPWFNRARKLAGFIVPGALLALLPKCPICLAAYVALGTGFTMSFASAQVLMHGLIVLCIGTLALCVARRLLNYYLQKPASNLQPTQARS